MSAHTKIAVLLSTYNGEKFLAEQLDSLLAQSHKNFILVVRDDGPMTEQFPFWRAMLAIIRKKSACYLPVAKIGEQVVALPSLSIT